MNKIVAVIIAVLAFITVRAQSVEAQYGQYGQYGGAAPSKSILIDKLVSTVGTTKGGNTDFVDNLAPSDPRFTPGSSILFKLQVRNTSDVRLDNVVVEDFLPPSVELVEGKTRIEVGSLEPDETAELVLKVRVKSQDKLPADRGMICEINRARVSANGVSDEDTAQFCIEKQVVGAKEVPQAGPAAGILLLAFNFLTLGTGLALRRKG